MYLLILLCELFINARMRTTIRHLKYLKLNSVSIIVAIIRSVIMFDRLFRKFGVSKNY